MRTLDLIVQETPVAPAASLAADRLLLDRARTTGRSLLRVAGFSGDVLALGRHHLTPAGGTGVTLHRRLTGGRALAAGDGFLTVSLYLPHRAALVADEPSALAPAQILNRAVRGLLGALEDVGVPALYPGRDLITTERRLLAGLGLLEEPSGATLIEAVLATGRDQSLLPHLLERADADGTVAASMLLPADVSSVARWIKRAPAPTELGAWLRAGYERRLELRVVPISAALPSDAPAEDAWLDARRPRAGLDRRARTATQLGALEVGLALGADGRIAATQVSGDLLSGGDAVERLEVGLVGCPPEARAVQAAVEAAVAPPAFLLGMSPLTIVTETILRAAGL